MDGCSLRFMGVNPLLGIVHWPDITNWFKVWSPNKQQDGCNQYYIEEEGLCGKGTSALLTIPLLHVRHKYNTNTIVYKYKYVYTWAGASLQFLLSILFKQRSNTVQTQAHKCMYILTRGSPPPQIWMSFQIFFENS